MRILIGLAILIFLASCSPDSPDDSEKPEEPVANAAPPVPELIYPTDNLLCIGAELTFKWSEVTDPEDDAVTYTIEVATDRSFTNLVESRTVNAHTLPLTLEKGIAYYWRTRAQDSNDHQSSYTKTNAFYVEGDATANYVPFTAKCIYPLPHTLIKDVQEIKLDWETVDLDGDELTYTVYMRTGSNTMTRIAESLTASEYTIQVAPGTTYTWRVDSADEFSESVGDFWQFTTE
tara:strand:+ start:5336 stop:6034 length:699 start_codon:yes stop_codon:yes gene_type:complete